MAAETFETLMDLRQEVSARRLKRMSRGIPGSGRLVDPGPRDAEKDDGQGHQDAYQEWMIR